MPPGHRRALTTARTPGAITVGGDRVLAARLREALLAAQAGDPADEIAASITHPLHSYPARMHPATARALLPLAAGAPGGTIVDPFCGSGTTLVEARHAGYAAIGVDANPLAVLIARAKTWTVAPARRAALRAQAGEIAAAARAAGKEARRSGYEPPPLRRPPGVDARARDRSLKHWFSPHVRRELEALAGAIDELRGRDAELADVLTVALSAIVYKVSRRASDTDPSRVERKVARGAPARLFEERVALLVTGLDELAGAADAPVPRVLLGDARDLAAGGLEDRSCDGVVSSPPYAGTYDYAAHHRLRLDFLGMSERSFTDTELGARRSFEGTSEERRRARRRWRRALAGTLAEMARVLRPGGRIALVIGDSVAGGQAVFALETLEAALAEDLRLVAWAGQSRPKLGRAEHEAFGERDKREYAVLIGR